MLDERGSALLEVIVATVVLGVSGLASTACIAEALRAVDRARATESETARASAFMDAAALWSGGDLERRLGERSQGPWRLRIDRPEPNLYVLTLSDSTAARNEILRTAVFRPDTTDAAS